ncbi:MAG TPA: 2-hydroxyacid dehydrogenase [Burkholderiales bacterium]|nr:2-hydroxyacid dehydrogenase [Burkholderiales bacterium]
MKLLIKKTDNDGRLALIPDFLTTSWTIEVADSSNREELARKILDADAMVSMNWSTDMPPAPRLRLLHLPGAGTDDIAFESVPEQAAVCNVYEHEIGIAEYILSAMLQWVIGIPRLDAALRRGLWYGSALSGPRHDELHGKTVGIIGYGRIGREVARRACAFGMKVLACSRTPRSGDEFVKRVEGMDRMPGLLHESDFVVLALPLEPSTAGLFGTQQLAKMKPSAVIINVARGALIDERALFEACKEKRIGGAVIDTWFKYPAQAGAVAEPSSLPFRELENIIMTPHASGWTEGLRPRRSKMIAANLDRLARGEPLVNVVKQPVAGR